MYKLLIKQDKKWVEYLLISRLFDVLIENEKLKQMGKLTKIKYERR